MLKVMYHYKSYKYSSLIQFVMAMIFADFKEPTPHIIKGKAAKSVVERPAAVVAVTLYAVALSVKKRPI